MNQSSSYQIVNEDALSSGMEDDDSSSDHHEEHDYRQETENTCNSHPHSNIGEIQRGWTYEDQFKEVKDCQLLKVAMLIANYNYFTLVSPDCYHNHEFVLCRLFLCMLYS